MLHTSRASFARKLRAYDDSFNNTEFYHDSFEGTPADSAADLDDYPGPPPNRNPNPIPNLTPRPTLSLSPTLTPSLSLSLTLALRPACGVEKEEPRTTASSHPTS